MENSFCRFLTISSLQIIAHATTASPSWHVQNFVADTWLKFRWHYSKLLLSSFNCDGTLVSEPGFPGPFMLSPPGSKLHIGSTTRSTQVWRILRQRRKVSHIVRFDIVTVPLLKNECRHEEIFVIDSNGNCHHDSDENFVNMMAYCFHWLQCVPPMPRSIFSSKETSILDTP